GRLLLLRLAPGGGVLLAGGCGLLVGHAGCSVRSDEGRGRVMETGAGRPLFSGLFQLLGTRAEGRCFRSKATVCACFFKRLSRRFASVWSPACSISRMASISRCRSESGSTARRADSASFPAQTAS